MGNYHVSTRECAAMRILARDDWGPSVLKMTMHVSDNAVVYRHVRGECSHEHEVSPVESWDGEAPADLSASERMVSGRVES